MRLQKQTSADEHVIYDEQCQTEGHSIDKTVLVMISALIYRR